MGVKGLWNYVGHHNIQYVFPNKKARADCYGVNPRHLLIDMNAVLHTAYDPGTPTTAGTLRTVALKIDEILSRVRPRDTLILVFDGVAPLAKLKVQKERRSSLSLCPPPPAKSAGSSQARGGAVRVPPWYTCDPVHGEVPLRREEIICGAEFVLACEEYVTAYLAKRQVQNSWTKFVLSSCREPGEGEVKISALLRRLWASTVGDGTFHAGDAVTIVGNDSDLILVAMAAVPFAFFTLIDPYDYSLTCLHALMEHWFNAVPNPPLPAELRASYRVDFVFLMLLAGDDYYEGIRADSVALWRRYRHLRANEGYFRRALISGPTMDLDVEFFRALLARTGSMAALTSRIPRNKRKTAKAVMRGGTCGGSAKEGMELLAAALWSMRGYITGRCADYGYLPHQEGPPSIGSLRAAAQVRGLPRKIGAGVRCCERGNETGEGRAEEASHHQRAAPILSPLEQCIAVLGMRGRFSMELRRTLELCTGDGGRALTTSVAVGFVTETVKKVVASADSSRLTEAERILSQGPCIGDGEGGGRLADASEELAFMQVAAIPSRKTAHDQAVGGERCRREDGADENGVEEEKVRDRGANMENDAEAQRL